MVSAVGQYQRHARKLICNFADGWQFFSISSAIHVVTEVYDRGKVAL
jgi:hypothetical protein